MSKDLKFKDLLSRPDLLPTYDLTHTLARVPAKIIRRVVPDRFLHRPGDPENGYITAERLNDNFKMLEARVAELEEILKNA